MLFGHSASPHRVDQRPGWSFSIAFALMISFFGPWMLAGCSPTVETHGHNLDPEQIAKIKPGRSSRQVVLQLLGSPSALSTFDDAAWYYVSQRTEQKSFYQKELVDQDVLTITFDDKDRVVSVDRHGLDRVAAIDPVERVTPTAGSSPSILKQLIGNIGRFSTGVDPDG